VHREALGWRIFAARQIEGVVGQGDGFFMISIHRTILSLFEKKTSA